MNARQFFDLVVSMRQAQKKYFALRRSGADRATCDEAKNYSIGIERQVDAEIKRVHDILRNGPSLFDKEDAV